MIWNICVLWNDYLDKDNTSLSFIILISIDFVVRKICIWIQAVLVSSCETLGKLLTFSEPLGHLSIVDNTAVS